MFDADVVLFFFLSLPPSPRPPPRVRGRAWVRGGRGVYVFVLKYKLEFPVGNEGLFPSCNPA